jgi:hypothetical protein
MTEVVRGDLKEGQELIVGTAPAGASGRPGTTPPAGPRLRM